MPRTHDTPTTITTIHREVPFFSLRGLTEFDRLHKVYVSQCLETGSLVTADDSDTATQMLKELLEDEISFAVEHENFANLFSSPAPPTIWVRWFKLAKIQEPQNMTLKVSATALRLDDLEVSTNVEMAVAPN
jgi:hypothetical protein